MPERLPITSFTDFSSSIQRLSMILFQLLDEILQCLPASDMVVALPVVQFFFKNLFEDNEVSSYILSMNTWTHN